jgi:hypothetical protein
MRLGGGGNFGISATNTRTLLENLMGVGQAFGVGDTITGVGAQSSAFCIFNPVASGKIVTVYFIDAFTNVNGTHFLSFVNAALGTAGIVPQNLSAGGAAGVATNTKANNIAAPTLPISQMQYGNGDSPHGSWLPMARLPAGRGIQFTSGTVNVQLWYTAIWVET